MNLNKLILVNNDCYKANKFINVKGIMVHSTGANNPTLKRYVGPDDGKLGKNTNNNHWNQAKPGGRQVCVHAFIGKLADGSVATYQTLPWNMRGWHGGSGPKGSVNDTHIGFEICEDGLTDAAYFNKAYNEAVELCAYLCKEFNLNPLTDGVIIGHYEGNARGIASNHGDPKNWFPKHGKSMDTFRAAVKSAMGGTTTTPVTPTPTPASQMYRVRKTWADAKSQIGAYTSLTNAKAMVDKNPSYIVFDNSGNVVYSASKTPATTTFKAYTVKVTADTLNIRKGPGTGYATNGSIKDKGTYTIVEESTGAGATKWGKLKSGAGWISLDFVKKL